MNFLAVLIGVAILSAVGGWYFCYWFGPMEIYLSEADVSDLTEEDKS